MKNSGEMGGIAGKVRLFVMAGETDIGGTAPLNDPEAARFMVGGTESR